MNLRTARLASTSNGNDRQTEWDGARGSVPRDAVEEVQLSVLPFPQQPMHARSVTALPDEDQLPGGAVYEPKFSGYRALIFVMPGWCRIQSRSGSDITRSFPDIAAAVLEHVPSGVVLDGELVVWGDDTSDFAELERRLSLGTDPAAGPTRPASFVAFDVLAGAGADLRTSPFRVRRQALTILLGDAPAPLHVVPQTRDADEARAWVVNYAEAHVGVEAVMAKGLATPYSPGADGWEQLAIRESVECVIGAVTGTLRAPRRLLLGVPDAEGTLRLVGVTRELTLPQSRRLGAALSAADASHPWAHSMPLTDVPGWADIDTAPTLVAPASVVEVVAGGTAPTGTWLEPRELIRSRPELRADEVRPPD